MSDEPAQPGPSAIDRRLLDLIAERVAGAPLNDDLAAVTETLRAIAAAAPEPLQPDEARAIFREILAAQRRLHRPTTVAYLGPAASFTHLATHTFFGVSVEAHAQASIPDVFRAVVRGDADYGVAPVENSTEGVERPTLDQFTVNRVQICGEVFIEVHHCLLARDPAAEVRRVYSHPQALAQCRDWLREHLPEAEQHLAASTARGAELAAAEPGAAAIATRLAATEYGLQVLHERIEDNSDNRTRFLIIGHEQPPPTGRDKTSLVFATPHRPGALHSALGVLQRHSINMTMIESRPTRQQPWEYLFFIDILGHVQDEAVAAALQDLHPVCPFVRVLGSYPEAD